MTTPTDPPTFHHMKLFVNAADKAEILAFGQRHAERLSAVPA